MKSLHLIECGNTNELLAPNEALCDDLDSSSLSIITDFTHVKPLVIDAHACAIEAERLMRMTHVRLKLVVDEHSALVGIVSHKDIDSQEVMKRVANGFTREELVVSDFMIPLNALTALAYQELENASIRDVLVTLGESTRQHCLVVDSEVQKIRGIVSVSNIIRLLRLPIELSGSSTFRDVYRKVKGL